MMAPSKFQESGRRKSFDLAREREFYRYLPRDHSAYPFAPFDDVSQSTFVAQPSRDPALNAFAQLGATRLGVQRAMISLFGRTHEYILAESTRTLDLSGRGVQDDQDNLWLGCCIIPREKGPGKYIASRDNEMVVPNTADDKQFKAFHPLSNAQFYAGVPIISSRGTTIGSFCIMDCQPKDSELDEPSLTFMKDMAGTIMRHLDMMRSNLENRQAKRMIVGLGNLIAGKATLGDSENLFGEVDAVKSFGGNAENRNSQQKQDTPDHQNLPYRGRGDIDSSGSQRTSVDSRQESKSTATVEDSSTNSSPASFGLKSTRPESTSFKTTNTGENNIPRAHKELFSRAANLLQESIEVDGVAFFDASIDSYGGLVNGTSHKVHESFQRETTSSSDECTETRHPLDPSKTADETGKMDHTNICRIFGVSTTDSPGTNRDLNSSDSEFAVHESFLKAISNRYPKGKIFNFNENGSISDDSSGGIQTSEDDDIGANSKTQTAGRPKSRGKKRKTSLKEDADYLIQVFRGARSIIFLPSWDSHKSKWFSGILVWTNAPNRIFTPDNELIYLRAFGNSVMAEVHRLDATMAEKAKTNLVSSISHELRSPLHGILGTSDILSDTAMNALQHGMVHTIESCGRTLLDIINHLLDFTYIDKFKKGSYLARKQRHGRDGRKSLSLPPHEGQQMAKGDQNGGRGARTHVQLDAILEEVVESVFAGHSFYNIPEVQPQALDNSTPGMLSKSTGPISKPVTIIFDIEADAKWSLLTQPGPWRRILMNVFGNALKYTHSGFIYLGLEASRETSQGSTKKQSEGQRDQHEEYQVVLKVKDTGQGISEKYLRNGLFTAFSQEDSFAPGSGLGLSIVRQAISSLGGSIDVSSTPNKGTEMSISAIMENVPVPETSEHSSSNEFLSSIRDLTNGKSIGFLGFGASLSTEMDKTLYGALDRLCEKWFHLKAKPLSLQDDITQDSCDFYLMVYTNLDNPDISGNRLTSFENNFVQKQSSTSPMIVICQSPEAAHNMSVVATKRAETSVVEFISQPCGPRKLAKALDLCIKRQQGLGRGENINEPTRWVEMPESSHLPLDIGPTDPPAERMKISKRPTADTMQRPGERSDPASPASTKSERLETPSSSGATTTAAQPQPSKDTETKDAENSRPSILLVEDNDLNLQLLVVYVKKEGFPYMTASNGQEALEVFKAHPGKFGAVFMDISMPVMDGLEASRQIRRFEIEYWGDDKSSKPKPQWHPTTIAALTGLDSPDAQKEAFASGIDTFLTKPIKRQDIGRILKSL